MPVQSSPRGTGEMPRRPLAPLIISAAVLACTLALIAVSAWPVLRPSRTIQITQAVLAPTAVSQAPTESPGPGQSQAPATRTVQAAGWLEAEPYYIAASALTDGVISKVLVLEGDHVQAGQPMARMVDDDARLSLAQAEADLARAQATLTQASAELTAAQQNWDQPYELERAVASTQAQLDERRAELAQLPALIRAQQAMLVQTQEELKSIEKAYKGNAAAEIEYITAREQASAQAARLDAIKASEPMLRAMVARLESEVTAAQRALELRIEDRARLDVAGAGVQLARAQVQLRQAVRAEAQLRLDRMTINAPITGYVQRRLKSPGDKVMLAMDTPHSAHIAHIYDPTRLQVRVDVPLADAAQVYTGQPCEVVVEVLPDRIFQGEVLIVTHEADLQKNTLQVKVKVIDPDLVLRPEMLTRVKFLGSGEPSRTRSGKADQTTLVTVRVQQHAIEGSGAAARVWAVVDRANGRGVLRPVPVTTLDSSEAGITGWATVTGAIQPGAILAADPAGCVPGQRVRLATAPDKKGGA